MKTFGLNPKKLILTLCILVVGVFGLALFVLTFRYPIRDMKVFVEAPTNAFPWMLAMAATNNSIPTDMTIAIPFEQATNRFVSETDLAQIKQAIPWNKTILHLYAPDAIVVESPTKAYAKFTRQHIFLYVRLVKGEKSWHVEDISSTTADLIGPPNWKERIAESLPR